MFGTWVFRGAVVGLLVAIGFDTSQATFFGYHHKPLPFSEVLWAGLAGAVAGLVVAIFLYALRMTRVDR